MAFKKDLPLLIFDLDGTLIDSARDVQIAMNKMLLKHGKNSVDYPTMVSHIGDGIKKLVCDFFPEFEIESEENLQKVNEFLTFYELDLTQNTTLYPGVADFLNSYQGPKALVTNKNIHPTIKILQHFDIYHTPWIDIIGGDSLAERKPSALPLNHVMKKAGIPPTQTWMIGDGRPDMQSATAAYCLKVAVHYGYSTPDELSKFNPNHVLKKFSDLNSLI